MRVRLLSDYRAVAYSQKVGGAMTYDSEFVLAGQDGKTYRLGRLPRKSGRGEVYPVFGERGKTRLWPRDEWKPIDFGHCVPEVLDQDGQNACCAFASVQAVHVARAIAGAPYVRLSAGNLYGRINGGSDTGAVLGDAIKALEVIGVCRASIIDMYTWRQSRWPADWKKDAPRFRVLEAWDCPSFDHVASAILCGFPVCLGVFVGRNFRVQSDGWLADYTGGGGGHAMCGIGLACHESRKTWGVAVVNSWGKDWGVNGMAIVPESYFKYSPFTDAWAVRVVVDPEGAE